jgi:DNA-binding FadR family transcriptional regulator
MPASVKVTAEGEVSPDGRTTVSAEGTIAAYSWQPPPERPARLAPLVSEQLLKRIAMGEFEPGQYLPTETALASEFKVSRAVVRESVRSLEERGVVVARQGRGTLVLERSQWSPFDPLIISVRLETEPTTKLFCDLADIRLAVECQLAASAAAHASPEQLGALTRVVEQQRTISIADPLYTQLDLEFHDLIAQASDNQIGQGIMLALAPALRAMRSLTNQIPGATEHTHKLHSRILQRVLARDSKGAGLAMREHLSWSRDHFLSLWSQELAKGSKWPGSRR